MIMMLRAIDEREVEIPRPEVPLKGLGRSQVRHRASNGAITTEYLIKYTRGVCGCVIKGVEQAAVCWTCRVAIRAMCDVTNPVTPAQIDWMSVHCRHHIRHCCYELCGMPICARHSALGPDGQPYCIAHYPLVHEEVKRSALFARCRTAAGDAPTLFSSFFASAHGSNDVL